MVLLICVVMLIYYLNKDLLTEHKIRNESYTGDDRDTYSYNGERLCINRRRIFRMEYNGETYVCDLKSGEPLFSYDKYLYDKHLKEMSSLAKMKNVRFVSCLHYGLSGFPVEKVLNNSNHAKYEKNIDKLVTLYYDVKKNQYCIRMRLNYKCTDDYTDDIDLLINISNSLLEVVKGKDMINEKMIDGVTKGNYVIRNMAYYQCTEETESIENQIQTRLRIIEKEKGKDETIKWLVRKKATFKYSNPTAYKDFDFDDLIDPRPISKILLAEHLYVYKYKQEKELERMLVERSKGEKITFLKSLFSKNFIWAANQATEDDIKEALEKISDDNYDLKEELPKMIEDARGCE